MASTSPSFVPDLLTWLGIGVAAASALYTTHRQLEIYKARCETTPTKPNNVGVEQVTEDAIKLETLALLARSVNPALRNAALKIITERALRDSSLNHILSELHSDDDRQGERALQAIRLLALLGPRGFHDRPVIFHALTAYLDTIAVPSARANVVFRILARFAGDENAVCVEHMRAAGLDRWLAENAFDEADRMDPAYYQLKIIVCNTPEAKLERAIQAENMRRNADAEFDDWVDTLGEAGMTEAEVLAGIFAVGH